MDKQVRIHRNIVTHKNVPMWERKSVKSIGFYSDLYTDIIEGSETDEVERWLDTEFENPFKPILEQIWKGVLLDEADYGFITKYMFSQHVRTPKYIKNNQHIWLDTAEKAVKKSMKRIADGHIDFS